MLPLERQLTTQALIKHYTQRPDICPVIDSFPPRLLWRHKGDCPHSGSLFCDHGRAFDFSQTKIHNLRLTLLSHHDIGTFNVSVNHSFLMGLP